MKYNIGLITENKAVIPEYMDQIKSVFGDGITINPYSIEDKSAYAPKKVSIFLVSAHTSKNYKEVEKKLPNDAVVIPVLLSFSNHDILQLKTYPKGMKAIFTNVSKRMAEECIVTLYQMGINHIDLMPYYPGGDYPNNIELAITPGELDIIPNGIKKIIDIGRRQISANTMAELALKIRKQSVLSTKKFLDYSQNQYNTFDSLSTLVSNYDKLYQKFISLVNSVEKGVIVLDEKLNVFDCNQLAIHILKQKKALIIGKPISNSNLLNVVERSKKMEYSIQENFKIDNNTIHADIRPILKGGRFLGSLITLECVNKENVSVDFKRGYIARYQFSDIVGRSVILGNIKKLANKMANTESSILITGESGTGKELFASSIHNSSNRKNGPFVAINCAAIPESLLESELFGYSEGAFTGAKRGGKKGLLEIANGGTVFFDEIEGMSLNVQLKLLRVIQEREIMPVGGNYVIPIDIRIISASNKNLLELMNEGKFRNDLYYRICTLPLNLPPLRDREGDVLILIEEFKSLLNTDFEMTDSAKKIMLNYRWPGNIRELRNAVEYLSLFDDEIIEEYQLPAPMLDSMLNYENNLHTEEKDIEFHILKHLNNAPCGRGNLQSLLLEDNIQITEANLRSIMKSLKDRDLINSGVGRTGSSITDKGKIEYENKVNRIK
ncbi:MAG: sigma 54-interacting transcriptional regulator [Tissierellia bacterium]|nr:sigma 54-interacting transcriptional regulator [Tissierellia bacterium]